MNDLREKDLAAFRVLSFSWRAQKAGGHGRLLGGNVEGQQSTKFVLKHPAIPSATTNNDPLCKVGWTGDTLARQGLPHPQEEEVAFC